MRWRVLILAMSLAATARADGARTRLGGTWTEATHPSGPEVMTGCWMWPSFTYELQLRGAKVHVDGTSHYRGGVAPPPLPMESLDGTRDGNHLSLQGTRTFSGGGPSDPADPTAPRPGPVTLDLTYDAKSGHLKGTRSGKPIELARVVAKRPKECGLPPALP